MYLHTVMQTEADMRVGYARTSTVEQVAGFEAQQRELAAAGCEKVFSEQLSSVDATRSQLTLALEFVREGDAFVVTKLDRLARSMRNLVDISDVLEKKGVSLVILALNVDTGTPSGRLMLNMFGSFAQFEREIMLERQREGVQRAKAAGLYKGRAPTARRQAANVVSLRAQGLTQDAIAKELGIGRASVQRILYEKAE
jgi:DNA invertase Pin-like site-specific DNA recombinase